VSLFVIKGLVPIPEVDVGEASESLGELTLEKRVSILPIGVYPNDLEVFNVFKSYN